MATFGERRFSLLLTLHLLAQVSERDAHRRSAEILFEVLLKLVGAFGIHPSTPSRP